jgi:hypothetical protein
MDEVRRETVKAFEGVFNARCVREPASGLTPPCVLEPFAASAAASEHASR